MGQTTFLNSRWFGWARRIFALAMVVVLTWVMVDGASQITWAPGLAGRFVVASVISTLGLLLWDRFAVVGRSTTMQVRSLDYVAAAVCAG